MARSTSVVARATSMRAAVQRERGLRQLGLAREHEEVRALAGVEARLFGGQQIGGRRLQRDGGVEAFARRRESGGGGAHLGGDALGDLVAQQVRAAFGERGRDDVGLRRALADRQGDADADVDVREPVRDQRLQRIVQPPSWSSGTVTVAAGKRHEQIRVLAACEAAEVVRGDQIELRAGALPCQGGVEFGDLPRGVDVGQLRAACQRVGHQRVDRLERARGAGGSSAM